MIKHERVSIFNQEKHSPVLACYASLLKLNDPRLPFIEEFPNLIRIDSIIGNIFEHSLRATDNDDRERFRVIKSIDEIGNALCSREFIGTPPNNGEPQNIGQMAHNYYKFRSFFTKKALLEYHTHPGYSGGMSTSDILNTIMYPRLALIRAMVSRSKVELLFQSELAAKLSVSTSWGAIKLLGQAEQLPVKTSYEKSKFWENLGYAFYSWDPNKFLYEDGSQSSFAHGLTLKRF
jgi:hypothetical protein